MLALRTAMRDLAAPGVRRLHLQQLSGNLSLVSFDGEPSPKRPLVVFMAWMLSQRKHLLKYADLYSARNYDILTVTVSPWQLMWPTKGSQKVARELAEYLMGPANDRPILVHGFSVGAYVWAEAVHYLSLQEDQGSCVFSRITGQIWDSAADASDIELGFPRAVFPNSPLLQEAMRSYIKLHHKVFYSMAMAHYLKARQAYYAGFVRAPALFIVSKKDPVGNVESNNSLRSAWDDQGIRTFWKCFDDSDHVSHYMKHPKEYKAEVEEFLSSLSLPPAQRAKL